MNRQEIELVRKELELLMNERSHLLRVVGAAAVLISNSDVMSLQPGTVSAAEVLSEMLNALPEETFKDALNSVHAERDNAFAS